MYTFLSASAPSSSSISHRHQPAQPLPKSSRNFPPICSIAAFRTRANCRRIAELNKSFSGSASGWGGIQEEEGAGGGGGSACIAGDGICRAAVAAGDGQSHHDMLLCMQLCNQQGVGLFSFVRLPPRVSRPFAGAPVYGMSLTHAERLSAAGYGFKGKLVRARRWPPL